MKENEPISKATRSEFLSKLKEYISKFEELRGFL